MLHLRSRLNYNEGSSVVWRDVLLLALLGFIALLIIVLSFINPKAKMAKDDIVPPGNVIIEVTWPGQLDIDVDTWSQAPGDVPVGYSNLGGVIFNLLRDDLGGQGDATNVNYESVFSRGIVPGEYIINVHLYRNRVNVYPVPVNVVMSIKRSDDTKSEQKLATKINLYKENEEVTAFRFKLTPDGEIVEGSVNTLFKPLRAVVPDL